VHSLIIHQATLSSTKSLTHQLQDTVFVIQTVSALPCQPTYSRIGKCTTQPVTTNTTVGLLLHSRHTDLQYGCLFPERNNVHNQQLDELCALYRQPLSTAPTTQHCNVSLSEQTLNWCRKWQLHQATVAS